MPHEREIPEREQVDSDLARARIQLGPVRVIPAFGVTNAGYDSNVFGTATDHVSDWSFTLNAGARFLTPFGSKTYLRVSAFPSYTWYDKLSDRRGFGGAYEVAFLGLYNRLKLQLQGIGSEGYSYYSSELNARALTRDTGGYGRLEVDLARRFALLASGSVRRIRYSQPEEPLGIPAPVELNNRTDSLARGGFRYDIRPEWSVSAEVEETWSSFVQDAAARDNTGTAYQATLHYDRPKFYATLTGGYRQGRAANGSTFPEYSTGTGAFFLSYFPIRWVELQGYGRRGVSYSIAVDNPYYFENRFGGAINVSLIPRVTLRGYGETGPNKYPVPVLVDGASVNRRDDVSSYGGGVVVSILPQATLNGLVTRWVYDSNVPGSTQAFTRYTIGLNLGAEFSR